MLNTSSHAAMSLPVFHFELIGHLKSSDPLREVCQN